MRSVLMVVIAFLCCDGLFAQDRDLSIRAELVWVDSQAGSHRLMLSQLTGDKWSDPLAVYTSENFITTPALSTDLSGNKLLIWSEQNDNSTVLMSARRASPDIEWQRARKLNGFKAENLSPSIIVDSSNRQWVFWSSNHEGLDDIYYSRKDGSKWSSPSRVHANNDVPDIQPIASLNKDLNVVVAWKAYDQPSGQYLTSQRVFTIDNSSKSRYKISLRNTQQESISDVIMPGFLPRNSAVALHFPNNNIEQSIRLDLNR
ncbi:MAG: hypothetical protein JKX81_06335 [Arenicella sp.]|nr:hypothetical protein [Arenicella sp.]